MIRSKIVIDVIFYIKVLKDNTDLCMVCMTDETENGHGLGQVSVEMWAYLSYSMFEKVVLS
jgi:hypothetical protein